MNSYSSKYFIFSISIVMFVFSFFLGKERNEVGIKNNASLNFKAPIVLTVIVTTVMMIWSSYTYEQSLFSSFTASYYYFILLFYFFIDKASDSRIINKIIVFSRSMGFIYSVLLIAQSLLYTKGIKFMVLQDAGTNNIMASNTIHGGLNVDSAAIIFNMVRIKEPADFISFTLLIILIDVIAQNKLVFNNFLPICVEFFYLIFVSQTRVYIIVDTILFAVTLLILLYKYSKVEFIILLTFMIIIFIVGTFALIIWFTEGSRQVSYSVRMDAIRYYLGEVPKGSIFGIGFPNTQWSTDVLHGNLLNFLGYEYYLDDVGIIGFYTVFGISGILIIILFIAKFITVVYKGYNKDVTVILLLFVCLTSISLFMFNVQRIVYLPFIFVLVNYFASNNSDNLRNCEVNFSTKGSLL
ncbi:hypothetical protein [Liquorilactobacillus oeni]|nr:hypothetical protein [Liquorilactobacillus oeni]